MEQQVSQSNPVTPTGNGQEPFDIKKYLSRIAENWYWFSLALFLALVTAFSFNRYSEPTYEVSTSLLLEADSYGKSNKDIESLGNGNRMFQGLGTTGSMLNIYNQEVVLSSTPIIERALNELNFEVSYYKVGRIQVVESYKDVPFIVEWDKKHIQPVGLRFNLHVRPDGNLTLDAEGGASLFDFNKNVKAGMAPQMVISETITTGSKIESENYSFFINLKENFNSSASGDYQFVFNTPQQLMNYYKKRISVYPINDKTSILQVTVTDNNIKKAMDFLNKLTEVYQQDNLDRKNKNASRTIDFIINQLQTISDSLYISQNQLQQFQDQTHVMNISLQSQQLLSQLNDLDKERVNLQTKNKFYDYLKNYISSGQNLEAIVAPSAMGITDPLLNKLIEDLNKLVVTKSSLIMNIRNTEHPQLKAINAQIESIKSTLLENANNILAQSKITLAGQNESFRKVQALVNALPATERNFVNINRKYKIHSDTYTLLLEKLSEAEIAKASNFPDSQIIESAFYNRLVSPNDRRNYMYALILGLMLPMSVLFLKDFFNNKIMTEEDLKSITNLPILGRIFQNRKEDTCSASLMLDNPNCPACDPYRTIRGKLNLLTMGKEKPVIAVTSTFQYEGKTYNAINIASSFALLKKKTILVDLDLLNSTYSEKYGIPSNRGVVNYMSGESQLSEIIFGSKHPFLSLIPVGRKPMNPGEILADQRLIRLLDELKKAYDVIIIDNLPIRLVADLFELREEINATVYVVRLGFTTRTALKSALEEASAYKLKGMGLLVNYLKNPGFSKNPAFSNDHGKKSNRSTPLTGIKSKVQTYHYEGKEELDQSTFQAE